LQRHGARWPGLGNPTVLAGLHAAMDDKMMFSEMRSAFAEAEEAQSDRVRESSYVLAGHGVRTRIVGQRLGAYIHLPLAHLQQDAESSPSRLSIDLWDGKATDVSFPLDRDIEDGVWAWDTSWSGDGRFVTNITPTSISCLDRSGPHIVGYARDSQHMSLHERGRPLQGPLTIWHNDRNVPLIHAGLVARNGRGVLLGGASGSGKSTSAIACLLAGYGFVSDDKTGLQLLADGSFVGHSLFCSTMLEANAIGRFAELAPYVLPSRYALQRKQLVLLSQVFPRRLLRSAPIKAVALATVTDRRQTQIRPATKGEALLALAPSSLMTGIESSGASGFDRLARLVDQVDCYWLDLGSDTGSIPRRVEEILTKAGEP